MMSEEERHALRREMEESTYRTEHRKGRRWLVRLPGPEMDERFGDECRNDTTDAWGFGDTEEEAYLNARQMYDRKAAQAKSDPLQESLQLTERTSSPV